jgi:hypothetical protein
MPFQLCNKCGLFERTHNRARPEQFPHKRGPLASSSLKVRTSPPQHSAVPPVSALPPPQYHPSIAPLLSHTETAHVTPRGEALPQIQSWLPSTSTPAGEYLPPWESLLSRQTHLPSRSARIIPFSHPVVSDGISCFVYDPLNPPLAQRENAHQAFSEGSHPMRFA